MNIPFTFRLLEQVRLFECVATREVGVFAREVTMYLKSVVSGGKKAVAVCGIRRRIQKPNDSVGKTCFNPLPVPP